MSMSGATGGGMATPMAGNYDESGNFVNMAPRPITGAGKPTATGMPPPVGANPVPQGVQQPNVYDQSANWLTQSGGMGGAAAGGAMNLMQGQAMPDQIGQGMSQYQNAFNNQVVGNYSQDLYNQTQQQLAGVGAQANAAGAFGGARHGLVEGEVYDNAQDNFSQFSGNLRRQGFMDAGNFANSDIQNRMQGQNMNQQGQMAGMNGMLGAAGQMRDLSKTGFNIGSSIGQQQAQQGLMGQMLNQQVMDGSQNMFNDFVNQPTNSTGFLAGVGGASPLANNQTRTDQSTPGLMDWFSTGMQAIPFI